MTKIARMTPTIPRGTVIGQQTGGPPLTEAEHFHKCEACGEYARSRRGARPRGTTAPSGQRSGAVMRSYFAALAFIRDEDDIVPGDAVECPNAMDAALQAQVLSHAAGNVGAVAYSRTENDVGVFSAAVIIKKFGDVPIDRGMLF